jgi:hypothetical protein
MIILIIINLLIKFFIELQKNQAIMRKTLLLSILFFIACAINIKDLSKKSIRKCEKECKPYEIFEDNSFTSEATDSLWLIYKNRKTEDPYCTCLRLCMQSDLICGTADLETKEFTYPTIGSPKSYLETDPNENGD